MTGRKGWRFISEDGDSVATVYADTFTEEEAKAQAKDLEKLYGPLELVPITLERDNRY